MPYNPETLLSYVHTAIEELLGPALKLMNQSNANSRGF